MLRHRPGLLALLAASAILPGAVLALTALPGLRGMRTLGPLLAFQGALAALVLALGAAGLLWPALVPPVPRSGSWEAKALMVTALVLLGTLANRAMRTFALTRRTT